MTKSVRILGFDPRSLRKSGVCRRLFGPLDRVQLRRDLEFVWSSVVERCRRRWGFDFHRRCPTDDGGCYEWMPTKQRHEDERPDAKTDTTAAAATPETSFARMAVGIESLNRGVRQRTIEFRNRYLLPIDNHADAVRSGSFLHRPKLVKDDQRSLNSYNSDHENIEAAAHTASASKENELSVSTFQSNDCDVVASLRFPRLDSEQQGNCSEALTFASFPDFKTSSKCQSAGDESFASAADSVALPSCPSSLPNTSPSLRASDGSTLAHLRRSPQRKRKHRPASIAEEGKVIIQ